MRQETPIPRFVTTAEAAAALGLSSRRVSMLIRAGAIPASRLGPLGNWRIPVEVIERLARGDSP